MQPGDLVQPLRPAPAGRFEPSEPTEEERLRARLARERKARAEAEEIGEGTLRGLYQRQRELELLEAVAGAANTAQSVDEAMQVAIDRVCEHTGWPVGHVYLAEPGTDDDVELVPTRIWHLDDPPRFATFREITEARTLATGVGLPGRIHQSGRPAWIVDVTKDPNFPRAKPATEIGVAAAFGFPALADDEVVAVLEFFLPAAAEPDERLLELLGHVGSQLGRVVERTRAREQVTRRAEDLNRHVGELERVNAELKEFAYVASHDLSEPLRTISSFVQLLAQRYQGRLDADADDFIGFVVEGTERMQRLIEDLLAYSRVGTRPLDFEAIDCSRLLARVEQDLAATIAETDASIEIGDLPLVRGDAEQLKRLFANLISNAIKFRGPEPPRVRIFAERESPGWRFSVIDSGIGIEGRHAERIFRVFQRLHPPDEYPGTGIGLSICRRIVERHGGQIWVEPAQDGGTAFQFTIPDPDRRGD